MENIKENGFQTLSPKEVRQMAEKKRYRTIGIIIILMAIASFWFFARGIDPEITSTFGLNTGANVIKIPDLKLPAYATILVFAGFSLAIGLIQLFKGFGENSNTVMGGMILLFVFSFLIWAIQGKSINLAGMLRLSLLQAIPLTLGALSGIMCERSGVVNIGIEGMMLIGALTGTLLASASGSIWIGLVSALIAGGLIGYIHALLSIKYKVDQIISGMFINIFATGITSFIAAKFLVEFPELNQPGTFQVIKIPLLSRIPIIGGILFQQNLLVYATFVLLFVVHIGLYQTKWGLRMRMVGEHPRAAETLGVDVYRTRYIAVTLGGILAGMGGAYLTLGSVGRFDRLMTAGRGFIGLASMIFGNWNPFGAFGASFIFGFATSLQGKLAILNVPIPSQFLLMAPYVATMIVLVGVVGQVTAPAADGVPYDKEESH